MPANPELAGFLQLTMSLRWCASSSSSLQRKELVEFNTNMSTGLGALENPKPTNMFRQRSPLVISTRRLPERLCSFPLDTGTIGQAVNTACT
uniref:Secreted protein n=1 Tax=Steinernema glaseri TaxID=37863 RepID=A0A1I7Y094_9BILA